MADPLDSVLTPTVPSDITTAPTVSDAMRRANSVQDILDQTVLKGTVANMQQQQETLKNLSDQTQATVASVEADRKTLRDAQTRRAELSKYPPFVTNIVGLFDPNFSPAHWNAQIRATASQIEDKTYQLQAYGDLAKLQNDMFAKQIDMTKLQYTTLTDQVNRTLDIRKQMQAETQYNQQYALQLSGEKRAREQAAREAESFNRGTLSYNIGLMDNNKLNSVLEGKDTSIPVSLAQDELNRRQQNAQALQIQRTQAESGTLQYAIQNMSDSDLALASQGKKQGIPQAAAIKEQQVREQIKFGLTSAKSQEQRAAAEAGRTELAFNQAQSAYQMSRLSDEELAKAREGGNSSINKQQATEEFIRREKQKLDLHSIQVATESNDMTLAEQKKKHFMVNLMSANPLELKAYQDQAAANGGHVTIGGVDFTTRDIAGAQTEYLKEQKDLGVQLAAEADAQTLTGSNVDEALRKGSNTSIALASPGVFADMNAVHTKYVQQIQNHINAGDNAGALKLSTDYLDEVNKKTDAYVKGFPDAQQPYVRARVNDIPATSSDAMGFLGVSALNPNALGANGRFSATYKAFALDVQNEMKGSGITAQLDSGGNPIFNIPSIKLDQVVQKVISNGNYADNFQQRRNINAVDMALQLLGKLNPAFTDIRPDSFTGQIVDPTTQTATTAFDENAMLRYLREKYNNDVASGVVPPQNPQNPKRIAPYDEQLLQFMESQPFQQQLYDYYTQGQTLSESAWFDTVAGGNPLEAYQYYVSNTRRGFQDYYAKVLQSKVQAALIAGTPGAGALGNVPAINPELINSINKLPPNFPGQQ